MLIQVIQVNIRLCNKPQYLVYRQLPERIVLLCHHKVVKFSHLSSKAISFKFCRFCFEGPEKPCFHSVKHHLPYWLGWCKSWKSPVWMDSDTAVEVLRRRSLSPFIKGEKSPSPLAFLAKLLVPDYQKVRSVIGVFE